MPNDLAKLSNVVKNEVVKKTDYNTKFSNIETQITFINKNALDHLADIKVLKTKPVDTSNFVARTKFSTDTNALDDKIDKVEKKFLMLLVLLKKTDFNSNITEVESKIPNISGLATNSSLTAVENKILHITSLITKTDSDAKLKKISDRVTNNKSKDILLDNELKKLKTLVGSTAKTKSDEGQIEDSFTRGFYYYLRQSYLVYECKIRSFNFNNGKISEWKSTGIFNYSNDSNMRGIEDPKTKLPELKNDGRMHVSLFGNYFEQNKVIILNNNNVIDICCVYELRQVNIPLNIEFTILNDLFGAMEITKNANTLKYKYKGYGICFDKGGSCSEGSINNGRNVLIFGVHESSLLHSNNKANNIYALGKDFVQGINNTSLYAEKVFSRNFTQPNKKFVLSLHYNGDNSYLFVNGKKELKFQCKTDQLVKKKVMHRKFKQQLESD